MTKLKPKPNRKLTEAESQDTLPSSTVLPQRPTITPKKLSCHNLSLRRFIDAYVDDVMSLNLRRQWEDVRTEYNALMNGNTISGMFRVYADIVRLQSYITAINACVETLRKWHDPKAISLLREQGFDYAYTPDTMLADLEAVVSRSQTESLELEQKEIEWQEMMKNSKTDKPSREYFGGWLDAISHRMGYRERAEGITVADFCRQINAILKDAKKMPEK